MNMIRALSISVAATALFAGLPAMAEDPPVRVGRISYLEGTVSFHAADQDNWSYATLNYPVVSGNAFWTEPDGRSEVQIGAVEIRMDHATEMELTQIDQSATHIDVPQGVVNIHFATPPLNGSVEVMTPAGPIELTQPGTYHIDAGQPTTDGTAAPVVQVTALEGRLDIPGPRSVLQVMPGETAVLSGNPPTFALQEGNSTPFDDWALSRERREEAHQAAQYVSPHMTGYEDLDNYGQWAPSPSYGQVWYPTSVAPGWAPYQQGHWAYVAPWGWTWIDDAPWGFAPFHYGRWAYVGNRWGWIPGEVVERPVYAPALVAFIGGSGWSVSLAVGGATQAIGWVPLGPQEVYHPWYPASVNYVRNVNITNVNRNVINNITVNNYRNVTVNNYANYQRAATVVPAGSFQSGRPVHAAMVQVSHEQLMRAPLTPTLSHLTPAPAAREEGHPMPAAAQGQMPHPAEQHPGAPEHPSATPQEVHAPGERPQETGVQQPNEQHEADAHAGTPQPHPQQEAHGGQPQQAQHAAYEHAPGPNIHRPATPQEQQQRLARFPSPEQHAQLPKANVPHPPQQTHLAPTPQGWQRTPAQPHPQPHPAPQQHDEHKPEPGQR